MLGLFDFIRTEFLHVIPLLAVGVFGIAVILERLRALYLAYPILNEEGFFDRVRDFVMDGKVGDAIALCERYRGKPVAEITKRALMRAHQPESLIENGLALAVEEASQRIQKRTNFLAMIANVATLMGLLGTIGGLINAFEAIGTVDAAQKTALLARGISQAMNHTMLGLAVAIPCMIAFSFLMNRTNKLVSESESSAVKVLDIIKQRYFESEVRASGNNPTPGRGIA